MSKKDLEEYVQIAKDLCYPHTFINKLYQCKNEHEISRVLHEARNSCR